jgi:uncharacterized integral membrane protein
MPHTRGVTTPEPRPANAPGTDPTLGPLGETRPTPPPAAAPGRGTPPAATTTSGRSTGRTIGRGLAAALLIFVTVVLVLFVMFNTQTVDISLVFADVDAPLVLALVIAAALGGLLVWLAGLVRRARRKNR